MITGEPTKSALRTGVDFILDHPKTAGFLAAIALAISLSPKASEVGSWICLLLALAFAIAMVAGFREKYRLHYAWVSLMLLLVLSLLGGFGCWLTRPAHNVQGELQKKSAAQLFEECKEAPARAASVVRQPSGVEMFIPPNTGIQYRVGDPKLSEQFQTDSHLAHCKVRYAPQDLSLRDLFITDFSNSSEVTAWKAGMLMFFADEKARIRIDFVVIENLDTASEFMSFYIPDSGEAVKASLFLSTQYRRYLNPQSLAMIAKAPGNSEQFDSRTLTFSNRIYLYIERDLSLRELAQISDAYKNHRLSVIVRGPEYVAIRRAAGPTQ